MEVARRAIPKPLTAAALAAVNVELYERGLTPEQAREWSETACWFPHLCSPPHPALAALVPYLPWLAGGAEVWTQIVLQFPHPTDRVLPEFEWHRDEPPEGREFRWIVGVPLTPSDAVHGGVQFPGRPELRLEPGDVVAFRGFEEHGSEPNVSGAVRYAVYFRLVD